jgi:hypothetical protein
VTSDHEHATDTPRWRSRVALTAAAALLAANVAIPLLFGDVYPFTSSPMFRDCPARCCNYKIIAADGRELPADEWLVQRVYDGNPVGYGVGIRPPAVLEQQFGEVADEAAVRRHIERQLTLPQHREHASVEVVQEVIGPLSDGNRVGVVQTNRWRVERTAEDKH